MELKSLLALFNEYFTFFVIFPLVLSLSVYLTIRLRFLQFSKLRLSFTHLFQSKGMSEGSISHYEAVSAVLAGNFGTGNISGMAVALTSAGPGALVWMWITAFLGAIIQYASCLLAVKYRAQNLAGEYTGGPMYYLRDGLGLKFLGTLFAIFTVFGSLTIGNFAQVNSIVLPLKSLGINPLFCGLVVAFCTMLVILGGVKRIARFASVVVPIKASIYLLTVLVILAFHYDKLPSALGLMLQAALNWPAAAGGVLGYGLMKTMTTGFDRGVFATDAGTGIVPILQSAAITKHPVVDGLVALVAPMLVMIVCTGTGLVLMVTGAWQQAGLYSTNMVTFAFERGLGSSLGSVFVTVALISFAYTTLLAWACCGERAMEFLCGSKLSASFKYLFIAAIPLGAIMQVDWVWLLADLAISLMLLLNVGAIAGLAREVIRDSHDYFPKKAPKKSS